jgi:hypothetical protein
MSLFDKKQDVMHTELTQHGRELLSNGQFKPKYYAFYDDDIVYDHSFLGVTEEQNEVQDRLLTNSLSFKPNKYYKSGSYDAVDSTIENQLASSELANQYRPSWDISVINEDIDDIQNSGSNVVTFNLGEHTVKYLKYYIGATPPAPEFQYVSDTFIEDGGGSNNGRRYKWIKLPSYIQINFIENNVGKLLKNFDLEVFSIETAGNIETLNPLKFVKNPTNVNEDNLLIDDQVNIVSEETLSRFQDLVTKYFIVQADSEISNTVEDTESYVRSSTYGSRIDNGEPC